ncbi:MAG: hypothetical protein QOF24_2988 [Verrucomicrobiota bacterium]|jgi:hypothetical protein
MHGVPADLPLAGFVGCTLDQVCIGQHQLQFHFSGERGVGGGRISVEGGWQAQDAAGALFDGFQEHSVRQQYRIHTLLGRTVIEFSIDAPRSFQLAFDSGDRLTIYDDSERYESFSVAPAGAEAIYV